MKTVTRRGWTAGLVVALALAAGPGAPGSAAAQAASSRRLLNLQGQLTGSDGQPLAGDHAIVVRLYNDPTSTDPAALLHEEPFAAVTVTRGVYNLAVGSTVELAAAVYEASDVFYELTLDGEALAPRRRVTSSLLAVNGDLLDGKDRTDFSAVGHDHGAVVMAPIAGQATSFDRNGDGLVDGEYVGESRYKMNVAWKRDMSEQSTTNTSWISIPERQLSFTKQKGDTDVLFWYHDQFVHYRNATGDGCKYRLLMDGNPIGEEKWDYTESACCYRGWSGPTSWLIPSANIPAGSHTFEMQWYRNSSNIAHCRVGWPGGTQENHMVAWEMPNPETGKSYAYSRNFDYHRITSVDNFTDVNGRSVTYTKKSAGTPLLVVYEDSIGKEMANHNWACRYRLLVDNNALPNLRSQGAREFRTHSGNWGGYRTWSSRLQWYLPAGQYGAGEHTFKIQATRMGAGGAASCNLGTTPANQQENFLLVLEQPQSGPQYLSAVSQAWPEYGFSGDGWTNLGDNRYVTYYKKWPAGKSMLRVSFQDLTGIYMYNSGQDSGACRYRVLVDGVPMGRENWSRNRQGGSTYWDIFPNDMEWWLTTVSDGWHTFQLQVDREAGAQLCHNGQYSWNIENFLLVEEY